VSINYEDDEWIGMRELLKICMPPDQDDDGFPRLLKWEKRGIDKDDFGGFSIKEKGIYFRKWDKFALSLLSEEEQEILRYGLTSSPSKPGKPVLKFPCSVSELRRFFKNEGLAGAISEESLAKLMATRLKEDTEQADTTAPIASEAQEQNADTLQAVSGNTAEQTDAAHSGARRDAKRTEQAERIDKRRAKVVALAQIAGEEQWARGERQISQRSVATFVQTHLESDASLHGQRGPVGTSTIRQDLGASKWKFSPPKGGPSGQS